MQPRPAAARFSSRNRHSPNGFVKYYPNDKYVILSSFAFLGLGYAIIVTELGSVILPLTLPIPESAGGVGVACVGRDQSPTPESGAAGVSNTSRSIVLHTVATTESPRLTRGSGFNFGRVGALLWEAILLGPEIPARPGRSAESLSSPPAEDLPDKEEQVLFMLQQAGEAAPREIAARLGWSRSTTQRVLTILLESERVERRGTTRATIYRPAARRTEAA